MPLAGVVPMTEDGGHHLVPGLYQFKCIPSFGFFKRVELMTKNEIAVIDEGKCILQLREVRPFSATSLI